MKKSTALCLTASTLFCSAFFAMAAFAAPESIKPNEQRLDDIVAVVNDEIITRSEFDQAVATAKMQTTQSRRNSPSDEALIKQVLNQLIDKKLQLEVAKQSGIETTETEVNSTIARIANENNITVKELYNRVNYEGLSTEGYRRELRDQLTLQKLQRKEVLPHVNLSPKEVDNFVKNNSFKDSGSKAYWLEDILIPLSDTPSSQELNEAETHARSIIAALHEGKNFHQIARLESTNKFAIEGGDLGWRTLPEIPSAFADAILKLNAKEITDPIRTSNGIHVVRVAGIRNTGQKATPDRKEIEQQLFQTKLEEESQNWIAKLRSQAFIITDFTA